MDLVVLILHVIAAVGIVGLVLVQHGKGADVGAAFGTGSAGSVFGSAGSANFLSRLTAILALVFFMTSIGLSFLNSRKTTDKGVMGTMANQPAAAQGAVDKAPATPGATDVPAVPVVKQEKADVPAAPVVKEAKADEAPKK